MTTSIEVAKARARSLSMGLAKALGIKEVTIEWDKDIRQSLQFYVGYFGSQRKQYNHEIAKWSCSHQIKEAFTNLMFKLLLVTGY